MKTKRLVLQPLTEEDFFCLQQLWLDAAAQDVCAQADSAQVFALIEKIKQTGSGMFWTLRLVEGKLIGTSELYRLDFTQSSAEVGCLLDVCFRRQGYMREALQALLHYAFTGLALSNLTARIKAGNNRSKALFTGLDFKEAAIEATGSDSGLQGFILSKEKYFEKLTVKNL